MKNAILATALCIAVAAPAVAGGYAEPVMEPEVIMDDIAASDDWVVPMLVLLVVAAAVSN